MRSIVNVICVIILLQMTGSVQAQQPDRVEQRLEQLQRELQLSAEQTQQIRTILENAQKQAEAARQEYRGDRVSARKATEDRQKMTDQMILNVLDKKQKATYQSMMSSRGRNRGLDALITRLKLTPEQATRVEVIWNESRDKIAKLRQQRGMRDHREMMRTIRDIIHERDKKIEKILNKEQKNEFNKIKDERRQNMGQRRGNRRRF